MIIKMAPRGLGREELADAIEFPRITDPADAINAEVKR